MRIYFDNAATTRTDERVIESMIPYLIEHYGNPSSVHFFGNKPKVLLEEARETIAEFISCKPKEIFFTGGGTEAINTAIKGIAFEYLNTKRKHIISSTAEHPAVLESLNYLEKNFGFNVNYVKPGKFARINPHEVVGHFTENTLLVCVMHSNNETGSINDVKTISEAAKERGIYYLCDTVQSLGKTELNVKNLGVSFAASSGHKIYCPKGIGFLFADERSKFHKYLHGGGQERNMRASTESIPLIAGFKKGIEIIKDNFKNEILHYNNISKYLISEMQSQFTGSVEFNSDSGCSLPNIINVKFDSGRLNFDPNVLILKLDLLGAAVSGGSACSSGSLKPSKVLLETGLSEAEALSSVRISVGRFNTLSDAESLINILNKLFNRV